VLGIFGASSAHRVSAQTAQPSHPDTLRVVQWNLEWFANGQEHDPDVQVAGARRLMKLLDADVYALCEIVNADSLRDLAASLPGGFSAVVSGFGSFADAPNDPDWSSAQKLALVYRNSKVRVLRSRALMAGNPDAYYNFSSGRYPYLVQAEVRGADGAWRALDFVVIHAKASSDYQSCQRRRWGAIGLKDTLDAAFGASRLLLTGDFNDDLDGTICASGASAYSNFVQDSTDANHYRSLTLALSKAGAYSLEGYANLIDHSIATNELATAYVPGSARWLRSFVLAAEPDYTSQISDHYPIEMKFFIGALPAGVDDISAAVSSVRLWPNPARGQLQVDGLPKDASVLDVLDVTGRKVAVAQAGAGRALISTAALAPGAYLLKAGAGGTFRFTVAP